MDNGSYGDDPTAQKYMERYEKAKALRENFVPLFEECYEYALPQRESFYYETVGQRRDDKIFDETAVVGVRFQRKSVTQSTMTSMMSPSMCSRFCKTLTSLRKCTNPLWIWL